MDSLLEHPSIIVDSLLPFAYLAVANLAYMLVVDMLCIIEILKLKHFTSSIAAWLVAIASFVDFNLSFGPSYSFVKDFAFVHQQEQFPELG